MFVHIGEVLEKKKIKRPRTCEFCGEAESDELEVTSVGSYDSDDWLDICDACRDSMM